MKNNDISHRLRRICAIIIGLVFLLAGIFKLLDPVGAGLVVEEYYRFLHLGFMMPTAKAVGVILALMESLLGAALVSGVWRKTVSVLSFILIIFFTIITLFLAIFNPEMECGCFGEVIHLSNFQTLLKNIILLVLAVLAFFPLRTLGKNRKRRTVAFFIVAASLVGFTAYSLSTIPLVDFTSFTPGSDLLSSKNWNGDTSGEDDYMSTFIYEKNGQVGAFTLDKLPDSTWTFVRTETIRINGPEVADNVPALSFTDAEGNYADEKAAVGNVLAISVYDVDKLKGGEWTKLADALDGAAAGGFTPLLLVAATPQMIDSLDVIIPEVRERLVPNTYHADRKTLLSMNRSNGGATWFNDGQLIRKFTRDNIPSEEEFLSMTGDDPTEAMLRHSTKGHLRFEGFILYVLAILMLL
ncbi:MAG: hypothetical protein IK076_02180 [Bacteroidales bacterium]|nr:hypothetical protein [Bacteroidales bacterium]